MEIIDRIETEELELNIRMAVTDGKIDDVEQCEELRQLTGLARNIPRLIRSMEYAIGKDGHRPLNLVVAYYYRKDDPDYQSGKRRARYFLAIRSYAAQSSALRGALKCTIGPHSAKRMGPFFILKKSVAI
jgi:hypothetical protein